MKQQLKKNGIWLGKMELPDLIQLASKKVTSAYPKYASTLGGSYLTKLKGRGMEFASTPGSHDSLGI